jgi:Rho-binding antiterminator
MKSPIACHLHDYIEIACLYSLEIELELTDGEHLRARAMTTKTVNREEWLVLRSDEKEITIPLNQLKRMKALQTNPYFTEINF